LSVVLAFFELRQEVEELAMDVAGNVDGCAKPREHAVVEQQGDGQAAQQGQLLLLQLGLSRLRVERVLVFKTPPRGVQTFPLGAPSRPAAAPGAPR
jgi:hypothetical protein